MKLLEDRILRDGQVRPGNVLKVDCFLNHQLDVDLLHPKCTDRRIKSARSFTAFLRMTE